MLYEILLALLPSLCVSIIMALYNHRQSKRYKDAQAREALRAEGEAVAGVAAGEHGEALLCAGDGPRKRGHQRRGGGWNQPVPGSDESI